MPIRTAPIPPQFKAKVATAQAQSQDAAKRRLIGIQKASPLLEFAQWLTANPQPGGFVLPMPDNVANMPSGTGHWSRRRRMKGDYHSSLDKLASLRLIPPPPKVPPERAIITARLFLRGTMDQDNLMARCKWPLDWLVRNGYLTDDSPKHLLWSGVPTQERCGKSPARLLLALSTAGAEGKPENNKEIKK